MLTYAPNAINATVSSAVTPVADKLSDKGWIFHHSETQLNRDFDTIKLRYTPEVSKNTTLGGAIQFFALGISALLAGSHSGPMVRAQLKEEIIQFISLDSINPASTVDSLRLTSPVAKKYADLYGAINYMASLNHGEDMFIDEETSHSATHVLGLVGAQKIRPPRIFSSGEDAAVLCWDLKGASLFLTISEGVASLMLNSDVNGATSLASAGIHAGPEMERLLLRLHNLIG